MFTVVAVQPSSHAILMPPNLNNTAADHQQDQARLLGLRAYICTLNSSLGKLRCCAEYTSCRSAWAKSLRRYACERVKLLSSCREEPDRRRPLCALSKVNL